MEIMLAIVSIVVLAVLLLYVGLRFGFPSIVSFIIIGMVVGPFGLGLITDQTVIDTIGEIGIVLLLFTIGLEFSFQTILRSWRAVLIGGIVQVCTTIVAITGITLAFDMPFNEALIFGFIVSLSSTAIVMKILQEKGEVDTVQGRTLLGILIFQDLAIIPMMLALPLLSGNEGGINLSAVPFQLTKIRADHPCYHRPCLLGDPPVPLPGRKGAEPRALPLYHRRHLYPDRMADKRGRPLVHARGVHRRPDHRGIRL